MAKWFELVLLWQQRSCTADHGQPPHLALKAVGLQDRMGNPSLGRLKQPKSISAQVKIPPAGEAPSLDLL
jgi:hypothetical protein